MYRAPGSVTPPADKATRVGGDLLGSTGVRPVRTVASEAANSLAEIRLGQEHLAHLKPFATLHLLSSLVLQGHPLDAAARPRRPHPRPPPPRRGPRPPHRLSRPQTLVRLTDHLTSVTVHAVPRTPNPTTPASKSVADNSTHREKATVCCQSGHPRGTDMFEATCRRHPPSPSSTSSNICAASVLPCLLSRRETSFTLLTAPAPRQRMIQL